MSDIRWHTGYQLALVPGAHDVDKELTRMIHKVLKEGFKLKGAKVVPTLSNNPKNDRYHRKEQQSHILGQFPVGEVRHDAGKAVLSELINKEAVYFITHPYNYSIGVDVETTIAQICLLGRTLKKKNIGVEQLTLVTTIGPYDLNHSFKRNEGSIESESLPWFLERLQQSGYSEIITIGSHSSKTSELAKDLNIYFRDIDPFRFILPSGPLGPFLYDNPGNKGKRSDFKERTEQMLPFVTYLKQNYGRQKKDLYFTATDEGSTELARQLAYSIWGSDEHVALVRKLRKSVGVSEIAGVDAQRSTASLEDLEGKIVIMPDDRRLSGGTTNQLAKELKERYKVKEVVCFISHDMSYVDNFGGHTSIDKLVFLETNPNSALDSVDERIHRLPMETTALTLAAEIYDSYVNKREQGKIKIR